MGIAKRLYLFCACVLLAGPLFAADKVRERAYLRTDKPCYLSGELVWVKFLTIDGEGRPSTLSKVGYVELLGDSTVVSRVKLELNGGWGEGYVDVPTTLPTGNYRLIAYTRYMRNEGEDVFFETPLAIVNTFVANERQEVDNSLSAFSFVGQKNTIALSLGQPEYVTRTEGEIRLNGLPPDIQTLSVSVAGLDLYGPGPGIENWLGGLRSISAVPFTGQILPEYEGPIISGKMIDFTTEKPAYAEGAYALLGFTGNDIRLFGGQIKENGDVAFYTRHVSGRHEVVTTILPYSETRYRIDVDDPFASHKAKELPVLKLNPAWEEALARRSVGLQVLHAYTADSLLREKKDKPWFQREPDSRYLLDEYTRFGTMEEVVIEFITSLRFRRIGGKRLLSVLMEEQTGFTIGNSLVLLDGIPIIDHETVFQYDPLKIREIDIYKGKYVFGGQIFDGMVFFSTYKSDYPGLSVGKSTQFFDYQGTLAPRLFYMPSYRTEAERRSPVPDYRHTLLWMPDIRTGGQSSVTIPFTTSDLTGDFVITVEGLTKEGKPILATEHFKVK